jgi:hypothetical protein
MVWVLSPDRKTVRLSLPPLPLDGLPEPIKVDVDLDVATVDAILDRLVDLRSQMVSPKLEPSEGEPPRRSKLTRCRFIWRMGGRAGAPYDRDLPNPF